MTRPPKLRRLHFLNALFAPLTGQDLYLARQIDAAITSSLPEAEERAPSDPAFVNAAATLFARLLAGAITTIFFTYAFVNMGMVSGILPVVGVPLPFISYGGTAMVTLGLALGILMSIARAKQLVQT